MQTIDFNDVTAQINALLGGVVDAINNIPAAQVPLLEQQGMPVCVSHTGAYGFFYWRVDMKPTDDQRVRQALSLIMDRQQMVDLAYGGYAKVGNDMFSLFDPAYPKDFPQKTQDIEQAKSLLKQAGYENLKMSSWTSDVYNGLVAMSQVFVEQAKAAGVTIDLQKVDPATYYGDKFCQWPNGDDWYSTRNYLEQVNFNQNWNQTHWKDAKYMALVKEARRTVDDAKRNEILRQCYQMDYDICYQSVPVFFDTLDGATQKVKGLVPDAQGASFSGGQLNTLWLA